MIRQGWPYFEGWPFQERWLQIDGLGIHYVDEGYGSRPVVMVHGNPAWSYMWRNLIPAVSSGHRAIAMDLMGFGKSDKPNPQNVAGLVILNTFLTTDFRIPPAAASKITPAIIKDSAMHPEKISEETMK